LKIKNSAFDKFSRCLLDVDDDEEEEEI